MLAAQLGLTLLLLAVCSFAPGFFVVRRLPWNPLEKLCGSIALSLIALYLLCFAAYCWMPDSLTAICRGGAAISFLLALATWKDIRRLIGSFGVRSALAGYGFLLIWTCAILAMVRNFSGAGWGGDWAEHFQRTLFFLHRFPTSTPIVGGFTLPARPPFMNVLGAFFLAQTQDRFEVFQLVFAFLNLFLFLPCCLLLRAVVRKRRAGVLPLVALFALNPMMMEHVTYPWTKALTAFFVVFALWLYLAGLRKNDGGRIVAAFLALAAGVLTHYSAGPYALFLAGHYLLRVSPKRPRRVRELAIIGGSCALLLLTWFGWSLAAYGTRDTLASNSSVKDARKYQGDTVAKIAANLYDTVVPAFLRDPDSLSMFDQPNATGRLRDDFFVIYQTNLVFGMGLAGGPLAIWLLYRAVRRSGKRGEESSFWLWLIPCVVLTGIAVVGERDLMGLAHLTLVPLEALGMTLVAASFPWRRAIALLVVAGCLVDFSFGVFLQERVQSLDNTPERTVFQGLSNVNGHLQIGANGPDSLSFPAWLNWFWKNRDNLCHQWLGQLAALPQENSDVVSLTAKVRQELGASSSYWDGWFPRHGGSIRMLGDHFAGPSFAGLNVASAALLLLFGGLIWVFWKQAMRFAPAAVPKPIMARKKAGRRR
jgi:hypothetical protein